jgi:nitrate/TMAO reductase-like tetraheme cytochrome c subunit
MRGRTSTSSSVYGLATVAIVAVVLALALVLGTPGTAAASPAPYPSDQQTGNDQCLSCHSKPGQVISFANGDKLSITIDSKAYSTAVHGHAGLACAACHSDYTAFPHPAKSAITLNDFTKQQSQMCQVCHKDKAKLVQDSVHATALTGGNQNAPVCADCHNPHTQPKIIDAQTGKVVASERVKVPETCARCHNAIYETYKQSVHGSALIGEGNPDVPTCIDCHGVHDISDPTTIAFRLASPQMCSNCHTDASVMGKYKLSTQVLTSYVSDFHGTTVTLFEKLSPDQQTNKPVCFDCHGIHDIAKTTDSQKGLAIKQNMLVACKKCHPDATTNFPDSWLSHYIPSPDRAPLVFYVNAFYYWIFIPGLIGGFLIFVISDAIRRRIDRAKKARHA